MYEAFIGEIMLFAGNFAPKNWALCNGQLMSIAQNSALFSILGTTYGGDGRTTFALPDLQGRLAVHSGNGAGPGLPQVTLGQVWGTPTNSLTVNNLPMHNHSVVSATASMDVNLSNDEEVDSPVDGYLRATPGTNTYADSANGVMGPVAINVPSDISGASQPVNNMQPTLVMNYCICLYGIFPSRN